MLQYITQALPEVFTLQNLILINVGMMIGIIFGSIPGLNGNLAIVVLIPFTFHMETVSSILMLCSIFFGSNFGGSISAILISTPGTNNAAATILDGYPLAQKGYPMKALSTALIASSFGGFFSAVCLLFFSVPIAKAAMLMQSPEYFMISLFGLSIIIFVSGKNLVKGIISGAIGILLSTVGLDSVSGLTRFTFGNMYLMNGLSVVALLLGMFAISQMIERVVKPEAVKASFLKKSDANDRLSRQEKKSLVPTMLRGSFIGSLIGALPGTGGAIAAFISYNEASRRAKKNEHFGEGEIKGIAASESANNGATCCVLIPLLTLGIPGDIVAATLMSALTMHGLIVGPQLFTNSGTTVYAIIVGCLFAQLFMFLQGKYLLKLFVKTTQIPYDLMTALLVVICCAGAYSINGMVIDVIVMVIFGIFAYLTMMVDYPTVPFILGLILGSTAESYLRNSMVVLKGNWLGFFQRPVCVALIIILIAIFVLSRRNEKRNKEEIQKPAQESCG
ncbi:MAG: Tricarboxylic transport membrane protein [Oscillospiraceae bacterium]|jgi:putative tricarboxylic transport membrane protein